MFFLVVAAVIAALAVIIATGGAAARELAKVSQPIFRPCENSIQQTPVASKDLNQFLVNMALFGGRVRCILEFARLLAWSTSWE